MPALRKRFEYLFLSTRGLVLVAAALISLVTAVGGTLSGPLAEWGVSAVTARLLGLQLDAAGRTGRIILLYHAIAVAVVAIEVYLITAALHLGRRWAAAINATVTLGYIATLAGGLAFGYLGRAQAWHWVFIGGLSLVALAGVLLAAALWPWRAANRAADKDHAHTPGMLDLERAAFFTMAVATLGSAAFGAVAGANMGRGFEPFFAEDVVRAAQRPPLQLAVIGHLHIMLTLVAVAAALLVGRWLDFCGPLHKAAMPLMIAGTAIITLGAWLVVVVERVAHYVIYGGSALVMLAALLLVIYGWRALVRERLAELGIARPTCGQRLRALVHDPLRFGALWQMVFMNLTTSGPGIYAAATLRKTFRVWPAADERVFLVGHWHILAGIVATILLLYFADLAGLRGRSRRWFGWLVIGGSDLAFAAAMVYALKPLFATGEGRARLAGLALWLADVGLALLLLTLAAFMVWRLLDLFRRDGRWARELEGER